MNYTNREVVRRLKQYDMFLNSLDLTTDEVQRERICDQLDKIEKQILLETNTEYEEQYMSLIGEEARFFSEEKNRLHKIISLSSINSDKTCRHIPQGGVKSPELDPIAIFSQPLGPSDTPFKMIKASLPTVNSLRLSQISFELKGTWDKIILHTPSKIDGVFNIMISKSYRQQ